MGKFSSYIEKNFTKILALYRVEKLVSLAVLVTTCQKLVVDARIALKAIFLHGRRLKFWVNFPHILREISLNFSTQQKSAYARRAQTLDLRT